MNNLRFAAATIATAALAICSAWNPARADESESYTYVATEVGGVVFESREVGAAGLAPGGHLSLVSTESTLRLHLQDHLNLPGQEVPVSIWSERKNVFRGCMPVRTIVSIPGIRPGQPVTVFIGNIEAFCSGRATTGVVTVSGAVGRPGRL